MQIKETLYKQNKDNSINQWAVFVEDNVITVEYGQKNGQLQTKTTECFGKNKGKSNETSDTEQAELEAISKYKKQIKKGYVTGETGESSVRLPMKVSVYQKHKNKVIFPCHSSPKLNGVNGEYKLVDGELYLKSRGGEDYKLIPQQVSEVIDIMNELGTDSLNGEIYLHGEHLQDITSAVKKHNEITPNLEFHVFDLPNVEEPWNIRQKKMGKCIDRNYVKFVPVYEHDSHEQLEEFHQDCIDLDFEGVVIRNWDGLYKYNQRSLDVFKFKIPQSAEFKVLDYKVDKNNEPVLVCTCEGGTFDVKPKGSRERRAEILKDIDSYIDQWYTVEFEMYSKDKIPLKPVGIGLRKCDSEGNPLE